MKKLILSLICVIAMSASAFAKNGQQVESVAKMNFEKNKAFKSDTRFFRWPPPIAVVCSGDGSSFGTIYTFENGRWVFVYAGALHQC